MEIISDFACVMKLACIILLRLLKGVVGEHLISLTAQRNSLT